MKILSKTYNLKLPAFYSHHYLINKTGFKEDLNKIRKKINFLGELGSDILLLDGGKKLPKGNTSDDYKIAIENINTICGIANSNNIKPTWHQHWGTMFDNEEQFINLMDNTKDSGLFFCPDTAQLVMSMIDPLDIMKMFKGRISYIHLKDLIENEPVNRYLGSSKPVDFKNNILSTQYKYYPYRFMDSGAYHINSKFRITEIARGIIDFKPIIKLIEDMKFEGWIVVDQDYTNYDPRESLDVNLKNLKYLFGGND